MENKAHEWSRFKNSNSWDTFEDEVIKRSRREEDEVQVVEELNKVRHIGDMTMRDLADVIGRYHYKLCDHPESYFVKVFCPGLMEDIRQDVSNTYSSLKVIEAATIIEEDRMGLPAIAHEQEGVEVAVPRHAAESGTKGSASRATARVGDLRLTLLWEHQGLPAFNSPTCRKRST